MHIACSSAKDPLFDLDMGGLRPLMTKILYQLI